MGGAAWPVAGSGIGAGNGVGMGTDAGNHRAYHAASGESGPARLSGEGIHKASRTPPDGFDSIAIVRGLGAPYSKVQVSALTARR